MKVIIAGSRTFGLRLLDWRHLEVTMEALDWDITEVVSGGAAGADGAGETWASDNNIPVKKMLPDWNKFGKRAGPIRNGEMADYADAAVVFWDGESKGSANMIAQMKARNKPCKVVIIHARPLGD